MLRYCCIIMINVGDEVKIIGNQRTSLNLIHLTGKVINISNLGGWVCIFTKNDNQIIKIQMNALILNKRNSLTKFKISNRSAFKPYKFLNENV